MGYTKQWIPAVTPASNLDNWKIIMQDIHDNLILNGWVQTLDPGQIADINAIQELPVQMNLNYFRIYRLNDGHGATGGEIYIKVFFALLRLNWTNTQGVTPGCWISISPSNEFNPGSTLTVGYPTSRTATYTSSAHTGNYGISMACSNPSLGFNGFVYGSGSIIANQGLNSPLSFMIQRHLNSDLEIENGFTVYAASNLDVTLTFNKLDMRASSKTFSSTFTTATVMNDHSARPYGGTVMALPGGVIQVAPVYYATPEIKQSPCIVSYIDTQIAAGTQFEVETVGGNVFNFIALGECSLWAGTSANYAMLYQ